jgi:hypothetical protein
VDFWEKQIAIRNKILKGGREAAERRQPEAPVAVPVVDWFLLQEQQARQAETERLERERRLSDEHTARLQQQAAGRQLAQSLWAQARSDLAAAVTELRRQVATAENKSNSTDDTQAGQGIVELAIAEKRLARAQAAYSQHCQRSPM